MSGQSGSSRARSTTTARSLPTTARDALSRRRLQLLGARPSNRLSLERTACVSELRRVVRSEGRVLVRGTFADRLDGYPTLFRFFPGARRICEDLPTIDETSAVFRGEKFTLEAHRRIQQRTCASLREFAARASKRADTSLALLSDDEFDSGLAALQEAAAQEAEVSPIVETVDL